jgi:hypothetical protein
MQFSLCQRRLGPGGNRNEARPPETETDRYDGKEDYSRSRRERRSAEEGRPEACESALDLVSENNHVSGHVAIDQTAFQSLPHAEQPLG